MIQQNSFEPKRSTMPTLLGLAPVSERKEFPTWLSPNLKTIIRDFDTCSMMQPGESILTLKLWNHVERSLEILAEEQEDYSRVTRVQISF